MNRDEVIALARQAGLPLAWISESGVLKWNDLERFAALIAQAEREACIAACNTVDIVGADECIEVIRSRTFVTQ